MQIGDLVIKDYTDWWPEGDQWGSGIVVELGSGSDYVAVHWSKIGLSWEPPDELVSVNESR